MNKNISKLFLNFVSSAFCAGIFAMAFVSSASAQWRWIDANGTIHISDSAPPSSVPDDKILSRPSGNRPSVRQTGTRVVGAEPAVTNNADSQLEAAQARIAAEQAKAEEERKRAENAQRHRACENARKRIRTFNTGERIRDTDSKGELYYLSDAEITERRKSALADEKAYCVN